MNFKNNFLRLVPAAFLFAVSYWFWLKTGGMCSGVVDEIVCLYEYKFGIYQPLHLGFKWLAVIMAAMALLPWGVYRGWILTVFPITLAISLLIILNISPYDSGILHISRSQMAVNSAVVLAVLSVVFVAVHYALVWYRRKP
jgi:hypothetical protein